MHTSGSSSSSTKAQYPWLDHTSFPGTIAITVKEVPRSSKAKGVWKVW